MSTIIVSAFIYIAYPNNPDDPEYLESATSSNLASSVWMYEDQDGIHQVRSGGISNQGRYATALRSGSILRLKLKENSAVHTLDFKIPDDAIDNVSLGDIAIISDLVPNP